MKDQHKIMMEVAGWTVFVILLVFLVMVAASHAQDGNEATIAIVDVDSSNNATRQAPAISSHIPLPTAPCLVAYGAAGSGPGIGLAFGKTSEDEGCTMREDIRTLQAVGMIDTAQRLACYLTSIERMSLQVECLREHGK